MNRLLQQRRGTMKYNRKYTTNTFNRRARTVKAIHKKREKKHEGLLIATGDIIIVTDQGESKLCTHATIQKEHATRSDEKKFLNASRPSEHTSIRGGNVKTFRWDHRLQIQNLFLVFKRFLSPVVMTMGLQYNIGEKPTVMLYTYINRYAGTPDKNKTFFFSVCVCFLPIHFGHQVRWTYQPGSHRIFNPPSFCGACLDFCREKDSAIPFPRRP